MKYYNVKTREIKEFTEEELEIENHNNKWIQYDIALNKIVIASINGYKVFPKDELGINRNNIITLLEYYKPIDHNSAFKIAKYYKVCPYCVGKLEDKNNVLILDCREDFSNIKKMQIDIYSEVSCCNNTYLIPFPKTKSTLARADFLKNELEQGKTVILKYLIKSMNIEILIDLIEVLEIDSSNDYEIMHEILNNNLYLDITNIENSDSELDISDSLKDEILFYLQFRR